METTELFTAREGVNQAIRALAEEAQGVIANAISDGLYVDGLTVPLDAFNKIASYYLSVVPLPASETAPSDDDTAKEE